jgi:CubicO group peptidase (beta-lactamase class C family)
VAETIGTKAGSVGMIIRCVFILAMLMVAWSRAEGAFDFQKTTNTLTTLIQKTLGEMGNPSLSIALVRGDEIIWTAAFGYANAHTKTRAGTDTLYNMQLAEQGKLKLNDPVNKYLTLPIRDDPQNSVTFQHVLSHWSGLTPWAGFTTNSAVPIWSGQPLPTLDAVAARLR